MKAVAIVAHHDDAVLWCGGTILKTQIECGWEWTIIVFCLPDPDKKRYFEDYCTTFNISEISFRYEDYQGGNKFCTNKKDEMVTNLREILKNNSYDFIFTHSFDQGGEYGGHVNHEEVREVVEEVFPLGNIVNFSYNPEFGYNGRATVARIDANFHVQLNYDELIDKATWCSKAPDAESSLKAIGYPCPNPEGFRNRNNSLLNFDKIFLSK